jgi:hypothetical protein
MPKVNPFHTNSPEYLPTHREVYHDIDTCPDGKRIKPQHREDGTGNKKHCLECEKLEHAHEHHHKHHDRPPQPDRRHA